MDWTWNASATRRLASTSTLTSSTWPPVSPTTFSRIGPSVRHGPHHDAHRSTTTGTSVERSRTAVSKVASVTSISVDFLSHNQFRLVNASGADLLPPRLAAVRWPSALP